MREPIRSTRSQPRCFPSSTRGVDPPCIDRTALIAAPLVWPGVTT